jgi:hypothetical protein
MAQELARHSSGPPSAPAQGARIDEVAKAITSCNLEILNGQLVPADDCRLMIAAVDADSQSRPSRAEAVEFAGKLLGAYGRLDVHDPDRFVDAIAETMTFYPKSIVAEMCHPVTGMPGQQKRAPNAPAEIKAWCDAVLLTRAALKYKARAILTEREKREKEAREFALLQEERKTPEERAAFTAKVKALRERRLANTISVEPLGD